MKAPLLVERLGFALFRASSARARTAAARTAAARTAAAPSPAARSGAARGGHAWRMLAVTGSCLTIAACSASTRGSAEHAEGADTHDEPSAHDSTTSAEQQGPGSSAAPTTSSAASEAAPPEPTAEERRAERLEALELSRARAALDAVSSPDNDLGVVFTIAPRTSDVPWLFVLENRGEEPVTVLARPDLVAFEVAPPEKPAPPASEPAPSPAPGTTKTTAATSKSAAPKSPPPPPWCGSLEPKASDSSLAESELVLAPGEMITYPFDPRPLCADAGILVEGAIITPRFGFAPKLKKVWRKGKMVEVEENAGAPFVARRVPPATTEALAAPAAQAPASGAKAASGGSSTEETPGPVLELKRLLGPKFVLGSTYPLEGVTALLPTGGANAGTAGPGAGAANESATATPDAANPEGREAGRGAAATDEREEPPPPVLEVVVRSLGTTSDPDASTMTVVVKNVSGKGQHLFVRRELFIFGITGPRGATFCQMQPSGRAPDKSQFSYLAPGGSTSLTTRLPEACPPGTFTTPGTYAVHAQLVANQSGSEHGLSAFVGNVVSEQPGRFEVKGTAKEARSAMRVSHR